MSREIDEVGSPLSLDSKSMPMEKAESSNALDAEAARIEELEYIQVSNVNVSNFINVKLSGQSNYSIWSAQMVSLLESQNISDIVERRGLEWQGTKSDKIIKRYESLVRGWINGSLEQVVFESVLNCKTPYEIWDKLNGLYAASIYGKLVSPDVFRMLKDTLADDDDGDENDGDENDGDDNDGDDESNNDGHTQLRTKLLHFTLEGRWKKAEAILKKHESAATMEVDSLCDTMLHLAIREGHNYFVKNLLNFIHDGAQIEHQDYYGLTALHTAALFNNKYAAELLVNKRKNLVAIENYQHELPLFIANRLGHFATFWHLFEVTENYLGDPPSNLNLNVDLLVYAIGIKQYDIPLKLVKIYPLLFTKDDTLLMALTRNFPSELGFWEALIYRCFPYNNFQKCSKTCHQSSALK